MIRTFTDQSAWKSAAGAAGCDLRPSGVPPLKDLDPEDMVDAAYRGLLAIRDGACMGVWHPAVPDYGQHDGGTAPEGRLADSADEWERYLAEDDVEWAP